MKVLVTDELWAVVGPLLPERGKSRFGGRPRVADRAVLAGIPFVLRTGVTWDYLPREMVCGSGVTCSRPLREW